MKILYFHQHFTTPNIGGGTRSYEMARRLIARGHTVTMVCGRTGDFGLSATPRKGCYRGFIEGIDVIQLDLPYSNYDNLPKRAWTFCRFAWSSIRLAVREKYDLLFATSTPLTAGVPGIVAKLIRRRKPFVFEVRDLWPELPKALGMRNPFLLTGMSVLEWLTYHFADACIGLSPGICEGIARRTPKNKQIAMIPNSCDLGVFRPGCREDLKLDGIEKDQMVAVFAGAHGIANGLDAVLDAAARLKQRKRDDIVLALIGDGKKKPILMKRAAEEGLTNCRFYDPVSKSVLSRILSSADVGMMVLANVPAFYYGTSPNKFFDYIASGLPVLNNYPGWLADIIRKEECGIAVAPDDPVAFADALETLADNPDRRHRMGQRARELAERDFDRDELANTLAQVLESSCHVT